MTSFESRINFYSEISHPYSVSREYHTKINALQDKQRRNWLKSKQSKRIRK